LQEIGEELAHKMKKGEIDRSVSFLRERRYKSARSLQSAAAEQKGGDHNEILSSRGKEKNLWL
jgi:hypothetical protein